MKWTICIASVPGRQKELASLMERLLPQVEKYKGLIEVLIFFNNFEYSLGYLRQELLNEAQGEYISHIDDDDMVPEDYCDLIFPLLDGTDYIGFKVRFIDNGKLMPPVFHSLKYEYWYQDASGYYRGVTHLNPLRTALARESSFPIERQTGEDEKWAAGVKAKTEHFIDKELYTYNHRHEDSIAYRYPEDHPEEFVYKHNQPHDTPVRPVFKTKYLRFHPKSTNAHH